MKKSNKSIKKHAYTIGIVILCILNFIIKINIPQLLPFSDANVYYNGVLTILNNNFNPFKLFVGYKPPFIFEITAFLFWIFGPSIKIGTILTVLASSLTLLYTYKLGKLLFGEIMGIGSALVLSLFPLFNSQSFQFTDAIFITPMTLATIYYFLTRNTLGYIISATVAVMTRETNIMLPMLCTILFTIEDYGVNKSIRSLSLNKIILLLIPLVPFTLWMYGNFLIFGWFLEPINVGFFTEQKNVFARVLTTINDGFIHNPAALFIVMIIPYTYQILTGHQRINLQKTQAFLMIIGLVITYISLYSIGPYHPRYLLPIYPLLIIMCVGSIYSVVHSRLTYIILITLCLFLLIYNVITYRFFLLRYWGESDLTIFQTQELFHNAIHRARQLSPNSALLVFPELYIWYDYAFGTKTNNYTKHIYYWNYMLDEKQQYIRLLNDMRDNNLTSIILILFPEDIQPYNFSLKTKRIDTIRSSSHNPNSYLLLYEFDIMQELL